MLRQVLEDADDVGVVEAEQRAAVHLQQLVAARQPPVQPHRAGGQHRTDVVVRVLLLAVNLSRKRIIIIIVVVVTREGDSTPFTTVIFKLYVFLVSTYGHTVHIMR